MFMGFGNSDIQQKKLGKKLKFGQEINQVAFKVNVFKSGIKFEK